MQVLYTYLNVPFLELKRRSLLQQAQAASETLEREYRELAGFIGGHSYGNYMQHLQTSDVDPTSGQPLPGFRFAFLVAFFTASPPRPGSSGSQSARTTKPNKKTKLFFTHSPKTRDQPR